jgi:hypothetical protein
MKDRPVAPKVEDVQDQMALAMEEAAKEKILAGDPAGAGAYPFKMPRVKGVAEARNEFTKIMRAVERGDTFLIRGPRNREALIMSADLFRQLQEAYLKVLGELETKKILENEETKQSFDAARKSENYVPLPEAKKRSSAKDKVSS